MLRYDFEQFARVFNQLLFWHHFPHVLVEVLFRQLPEYCADLLLIFSFIRILVKVVDQGQDCGECLDANLFVLLHQHALVHDVNLEDDRVFQAGFLALGSQVDECEGRVKYRFNLLEVQIFFFKLIHGIFKVLPYLVDV